MDGVSDDIGMLRSSNERTRGSRREAWESTAIVRWIGIALTAIAAAAMAYVVSADGSGPERVARSIATVIVGCVVARAIWSRPRIAVALAALSGAVTGAAGKAIGYDRLHAGEVAAVNAAAVAAFVAGVGLIGWAALSLTIRVSPSRRPVVVAVAGLVIAILWNVMIVPVTDAIAATNVVPTPLGPETPAEFGLEYESVEFVTSDGVTLRGWYIPSSNGAAVAVVHGLYANRSAVLPAAAAVARRGFGVLVFDSRGHGESAGVAMDFGWRGEEDILAAVSFLEGRTDVNPAGIGVIGFSLGGEEAVGAAAADARIRAVVADGITYRRDGDWTPRSDDGPLGDVQDWLMFTAAGLLSSTGRPETIRDSFDRMAPRPVLLIASGSGSEIEVTTYLSDAHPDDVAVVEFPDVDHLGGFVEHTAEWTDAVVTFLEQHLTDGQ